MSETGETLLGEGVASSLMSMTNQPQLNPPIEWDEHESRHRAYNLQEKGNPRAFISSDTKTADLVDLR